jgi:hypothetical protein
MSGLAKSHGAPVSHIQPAQTVSFLPPNTEEPMGPPRKAPAVAGGRERPHSCCAVNMGTPPHSRLPLGTVIKGDFREDLAFGLASLGSEPFWLCRSCY